MSAHSIPESLGIIGNPPNLQVDGLTAEDLALSPELYSSKVTTPTLTPTGGDASVYTAASSPYIYTVNGNQVGIDGTLALSNTSGAASILSVTVSLPVGLPANAAYPATIQGIATLQNDTAHTGLDTNWAFSRLSNTSFSISTPSSTPVPNGASCTVHYRISFIAP